MGLMIRLSICALLVICACGDSGQPGPVQPVIDQEAQRVMDELRDRSFRRFHPSRDAPERRAVILDFFENSGKKISLWAQYALNETALAEWEVAAGSFRVEKAGSEYTLFPVEPTSSRSLPTLCENCIPVSGLSISVRNLFDGGNIQFKVNNAGNGLPVPFPVFEDWATWSEDEYFDG